MTESTEITLGKLSAESEGIKTFELKGTRRDSKRRGQVTQQQSLDADSENDGNSLACGEIITLRAESATQCIDWVKAIKAAVLMVSLGLTSLEEDGESDGSDSARQRGVVPQNKELDHLISLDSFSSKVSSPIANNRVDSALMQTSMFSSRPEAKGDDDGRSESKGSKSSVNTSSESKSPSMWDRVKSVVVSPRGYSPKRSNKTDGNSENTPTSKYKNFR